MAGEPLSENAYLLRSALGTNPAVVGKVRSSGGTISDADHREGLCIRGVKMDKCGSHELLLQAATTDN